MEGGEEELVVRLRFRERGSAAAGGVGADGEEPRLQKPLLRSAVPGGGGWRGSETRRWPERRRGERRQHEHVADFTCPAVVVPGLLQFPVNLATSNIQNENRLAAAKSYFFRNNCNTKILKTS